MKRLFNEHSKRKVIDLNGAWLFKLDPDKVGINEGWSAGLPDGETVTVPSCWNNQLGLLNYEGACWYEKKFNSSSDTLFLEFGSVMTEAMVWLDGEYVGEHYGAFTQFDFIVKPKKQGQHTLVVRVDNTITEKSFPQRYTDWFNYGGIARDVAVHELSGIAILGNHVRYELSADLSNAKISCELELYNAVNDKCTQPISVTLDGTVIYSGEITLEANERIKITTPVYEFKDVELWDTDFPRLYTAVAKTDSDDLADRVGFRRVEVANNNILLNGRSIELRGVNRHEEHPDWGFAFPQGLMKKDIDLILNMGCNTIRGSHYPQTQIFVDMLDERGILFWSEIPMWGVGFGEKALSDPDIVERGYVMHQEMTKYYYNHPSIIIWGMHNEVNTPCPPVYEISKKYNEHLRANGGNRLITHAANHYFDDSSMEFDDIICLNAYFGWYGGKVQDWDKFVADFGEHIKKKGWGHKPVIMSEFGAAALAGFHQHFDTIRWSEEFQADLLEYCLELFHRTDYMRGFYIWQFTNIRTSPSMDINRARYFNNKGIVDEYRNPKAAYFKVRELYKKYAAE
ncbi:MAG: beta-glucuronidase [Clostridia bacterium]|nr:beta-glucuronidase [Clostridia bacterium]